MPKRTPPPDGDNVVPLPPRAKHVFTPGESAKGLAAAKARNHKPARGGPPRSTRDDKSGEGWGGAAKGASSTSGDLTIARLTPSNTAAAREARQATNARMKEILAEIAEDSQAPPAARVSAVNAWLDRDEGKAVQMSLNGDAGEEAIRAIERRIVDTAPDKGNHAPDTSNRSARG